MRQIKTSRRGRGELAGLRARLCGAAAVLLLGWLGTGSLGAQAPGAGAQAPPQPAAPQEPWMSLPPTSTGPAVGEKIPPFRAPDQNGNMQDFNSIRGPKGAAIYFVRSADW